MKIQELKYNLYLVDFAEVEHEILYSLKRELDRLGVMSIEDIPKKDYLKLLKYFTLYSICKGYSMLENKKNTVFFVHTPSTNTDILSFVKEIKKNFPILLYLSSDTFILKDQAVYTEITLKIKEFRYGIDYSKFSFNKIKYPIS